MTSGPGLPLAGLTVVALEQAVPALGQHTAAIRAELGFPSG